MKPERGRRYQGWTQLGSLLVTLLTVAGSWATEASAQQAPHSRVVVIVDRNGSAALAAGTQRLIGELKGAGFEVAVVDHVAGSEPREEAELRAEAPLGVDGQTEAAPFATIALASARAGTADVWVVDRITKKTLVRHLTSDDAPDTLAIRASELLRASLFEILAAPDVTLPSDVSTWLGPVPAASEKPSEPSDDAQPDESAPTPAPKAPPKRTGRIDDPSDREGWPGTTLQPTVHKDKAHPRMPIVGTSFVVLGSVHGFTTAVGPSIDVRYRFDKLPLELGGRVAAPAFSHDLYGADTTLGSATLRHGEMDITLMYRPVHDDEVLQPGIGAGLGAYLLDVSGSSQVTTFSHHDSVSFAPSATADLQLRFHDRVRGVLGLSALFVLPEPVVVIAGATAGQAGEPLLMGSAGVEVVL